MLSLGWQKRTLGQFLLLLVGIGFFLYFFQPAGNSFSHNSSIDTTTVDSINWQAEAQRMVELQIEERGIDNKRVLTVMRQIPRHLFVPPEQREKAYRDRPLSIGQGQTISQPYIVALMTDKLQVKPGDKVLEIGTGSGYQAAVLAHLADTVYTIEIKSKLARSARHRLQKLNYNNTIVKHGNGYKGWPAHAPFDKIIVTAAPEEVPETLKNQLKVGGRMIVPVGETTQELMLLIKRNGEMVKRTITPVRFVPMIHSE